MTQPDEVLNFCVACYTFCLCALVVGDSRSSSLCVDKKYHSSHCMGDGLIP